MRPSTTPWHAASRVAGTPRLSRAACRWRRAHPPRPPGHRRPAARGAPRGNWGGRGQSCCGVAGSGLPRRPRPGCPWLRPAPPRATVLPVPPPAGRRPTVPVPAGRRPRSRAPGPGPALGAANGGRSALGAVCPSPAPPPCTAVRSLPMQRARGEQLRGGSWRPGNLAQNGLGAHE